MHTAIVFLVENSNKTAFLLCIIRAMQQFQKLKNATIVIDLINRGENSDVVLRESGGAKGGEW